METENKKLVDGRGPTPSPTVPCPKPCRVGSLDRRVALFVCVFRVESIGSLPPSKQASPADPESLTAVLKSERERRRERGSLTS